MTKNPIPKENFIFEDKFWILNTKQETLERVIVRLKCRVLSHYYNDPRFESMIIIDNHQIVIHDSQKGDPRSPFNHRLALVKDGITVLEYHHNDTKTVQKWKEQLEACSKDVSFFWRYREIENICRTPTSEVFKVQNLHDLKIYAAKKFDLRKKKADTTSIFNEVRILRRLEHTGLIQLHEVYIEKRSIILIMEYFNGGDLSQKIAKCKSYKEDKAAKLMKNLLEIVKYLDDQSLVHKDIKPSNILLCNENSDTAIKLIDFGLSSYTYSPNVNHPSGTPGYMAPEILRKKEVTTKSDIYACGLVLYFVLTGLPAFCGINIETRIEENYGGNISFDQLCWKNISEECKAFLKALLAKNPKDRPTSAQALKSPWIRKHTGYQMLTTVSYKEQQIPEISLFTSLNFDDAEKIEKQNTLKSKQKGTLIKQELEDSETETNFEKMRVLGGLNAFNSLTDNEGINHEVINTTSVIHHTNVNIIMHNKNEEEEDYANDIEENLSLLDLEKRDPIAKFIRTLKNINNNSSQAKISHLEYSSL